MEYETSLGQRSLAPGHLYWLQEASVTFMKFSEGNTQALLAGSVTEEELAKGSFWQVRPWGGGQNPAEVSHPEQTSDRSGGLSLGTEAWVRAAALVGGDRDCHGPPQPGPLP